MKNTIRLLSAICILCSAIPANASFGQSSFNRPISCLDPVTELLLNIINGAPNGDYSVKLTAETQSTDLKVDGADFPTDGVTKDFSIPNANSKGVKFNVGYDLAALQTMGEFEDFDIKFSLEPGDALTNSTGFGTSTATLTVSDEGCDGGDPPAPEPTENPLEDAIDEVEASSFEAINVATLASADQDLKVNVTYKVPTTAFNILVGELEEGENITDKAKEVAEKFGLKLDLKRLKKEAGKELRKATKGLKGEEKTAAEVEARKTGFLKLLDEITLKLPKVKDAKDKEAAKKIRKAKKKKILEAIDVEVKEVTENAETGKTCLSFVITLPAKVCAKDGGDKALVIAGQEISIMNLEPGETFSIDLPVQIKGLFKEFFGVETAARKKKGKKGPNGKTSITLTLINAVTAE